MLKLIHLTTGKYVSSFWAPSIFNSTEYFFLLSTSHIKEVFERLMDKCTLYPLSFCYEDGSYSYNLNFHPDEFELVEVWMFRILHLTTGKYLSCFYCPHTSFFFGLNPNKEVKKQYIAMIDKLKERKEVEIMYHNENTWIRSFFSPDEFELVEM